MGKGPGKSSKYTKKMFKKIGSLGEENLRAACPMDKMNFKFFSSPVAIESLSGKKQPTFCNATKGFPMKWYLRNKHRNSIPRFTSFGKGTVESVAKMLLVFSGYWKSPHLNVLQMQPMSLILSSFYSSFL